MNGENTDEIKERLGLKPDVRITNNLCQSVFRNILRAQEEKNVYPETKLRAISNKPHLTINMEKREESIDKEHEIATRKQTNATEVKKKFVSNIVFDDNYVELNQVRKPQLRTKKDIDQQFPVESKKKKKYFYDLYTPQTTTNKAFLQKLSDTYNTNPIEVLSPTQREELLNKQKAKTLLKTQRVTAMLSSDLLKSAVLSENQDGCSYEDKVTNIEFKKIQNAIKSKSTEKSFNKKKWNHAPGGGKQGFYM